MERGLDDGYWRAGGCAFVVVRASLHWVYIALPYFDVSKGGDGGFCCQRACWEARDRA